MYKRRRKKENSSTRILRYQNWAYDLGNLNRNNGPLYPQSKSYQLETSLLITVLSAVTSQKYSLTLSQNDARKTKQNPLVIPALLSTLILSRIFLKKMNISSNQIMAFQSYVF